MHLFTLGAGARVVMELGVGIGRRYQAADAPGGTTPAGAISVDAAYSPITRVAYNVEMSRLGKITDYEKLVLEVWTNGAVSPDDALTRASTFLRDHFSPLAPPGARRGRGSRDRRGRRVSCATRSARRWRSWLCRPGPSTPSRAPS